MKRRVVQHGPSTLILSLPSKWVKEHGIQKGDELEVDHFGSSLVVQTNKKKRDFKTEIDLNEYNPLTQRILHALYKKGYNEVKINYERPEALEMIQRLMREEAVGFEITERKENSCTIRTIAGEFDSEFDIMVKRIFTQLHVMNEGIIESLNRKDAKILPSIRYLEKDNNKYTGFCRRVLNKGGVSRQRKNLTYLYCAIEELEKIADEYKYMCDFLMENNNIAEINKEVVAIFRDINSLLTQTQQLFFVYSKENLIKAYELRKHIIRTSFGLFNSVEKKDIVVLEYAKKIAQLNANILGFKMQMEI